MTAQQIIKDYLKKKQLTNTQFAKLTGVPASTMIDIVKNGCHYTQTMYERISKVVEIPEPQEKEEVDDAFTKENIKKRLAEKPIKLTYAQQLRETYLN